jgi:hypothetical protein
MSKSERHARILSILGESDELSIHELTRRLGRVSSVTVRRDVTELAAEGALHRTHGTVSKPDSQTATHAATVGDSQDQIGDVDAIILPPIEGRGADTLRGMARRRKIPFLAESAAQEGGIYLGPDNFSVGRELGHRAGRALAGLRSTLPGNRRSSCDRLSGESTGGRSHAGGNPDAACHSDAAEHREILPARAEWLEPDPGSGERAHFRSARRPGGWPSPRSALYRTIPRTTGIATWRGRCANRISRENDKWRKVNSKAAWR